MSHNNNHLKQDNSAYSPNLPPPSPDASAPPLPSFQQYPEQEYPPHLFPTPPSPLLYASSPVRVYTPPPVYHAQLHQVDGYPQRQGPFVFPPPAVAYQERNVPKDHRREDSRGKTKRGCCCSGFWRGCCAALCCCCLMDLCCMSNCCF